MYRAFVQLFVLIILVLAPQWAKAQESDEDLAKKLANPAASLISVPFQSNFDCCYGPDKGLRYTLNLQPVIPFSLGPEWNVIVRTVTPFIDLARTSPASGAHFGLGDVTQSFFFSPSQSVNGITWAVGPVALWPTGDSVLGSRKWGLGPTGLVLRQAGGWTYGILANQIWSYAGPQSVRRVSSTFLQPFVSYTFADTTSLGLNTEATYDRVGRQWTVPINVSIGHIFKFSGQPVNIALGGKAYAVSPSGGPAWGVRLTATVLLAQAK